MIPLRVTFRNMGPSPYVRARIKERADKLDVFDPRIVSCRVVVEKTQHRHRKGDLYGVSVDVKRPGAEIAANRTPAKRHAHEDVYVAIRDAFDAVERRVEDRVRRRRGDVKAHQGPPSGKVTRLFPDEGYGFIVDADGNEIYFHRNAVANWGFARLREGAAVVFVAVAGEKGAQASTVKPLGKHSLRA